MMMLAKEGNEKANILSGNLYNNYKVNLNVDEQNNIDHFDEVTKIIDEKKHAYNSIIVIDLGEGLQSDLKNRGLIINLSSIQYTMPAGLNALEKIENEYKNVELIFTKNKRK